MKKVLRSICPSFLHSFYARTKFWLRFHFAPKGLANELHKSLVGYDIDWKNPKTLNEKINWMKFNYDTSEWTRLADKYLVREYVKERVGEDILPKIYGIWEKASEMDFNDLPPKFMIKTNHGCGTVIPVCDSKKCDVDKMRVQVEKWMSKRFGYETIEPHYLKIKPLVYAEELLENDSTESSSIIDYKVFCINGKAQCVLICKDRSIGHHPHFAFYDLDWNLRTDWLAPKYRGNVGVKRPQCLSQLLSYADKLASGHPQVRVDFYIVKGKIYFGEMTFTSQGGYMDYIADDLLLKMGELIKL